MKGAQWHLVKPKSLSPKIKSYYTVRSSPVSLWKQYFQYGFWKIRVLQKHPKQMSLRQFVPFLFVSSIILSLILALLSEWGWLFLISFLGFYLVANLLASVATLRKYKLEKKPLSLLLLAFSIIHTGYGFGFFLGLFHFWNRWNDRIGNVPGYWLVDLNLSTFKTQVIFLTWILSGSIYDWSYNTWNFVLNAFCPSPILTSLLMKKAFVIFVVYILHQHILERMRSFNE